MKRLPFAAVFFLSVAASVSSAEIVFAPLVIEGRDEDGPIIPDEVDFTRRLMHCIDELDLLDALDMRLGKTSPEQEAVVSVLDAASFATFNGAEILVYGRLAFTEHYIDAVLRIFDPEGGEILETFYGRDSSERDERLMEDAAGKIHEYLTNDLGLTPIVPRREIETKLWDWRISLDYWTPVGDWREALSGLVSLGGAGFLTPVYPLFREKAWLFGLRAGASFLYATGIGTPETEEFFYNGIRFGIPVEFMADYRENHRLAFTLQPFVSMDMIFQERKYSGTWTGVTVTGGIAVGTYYRYRLNEKSSLGLSTEVSFVFYEPLRIEIRPGLFYERRIGSRRKEKGAPSDEQED